MSLGRLDIDLMIKIEVSVIVFFIFGFDRRVRLHFCNHFIFMLLFSFQMSKTLPLDVATAWYVNFAKRSLQSNPNNEQPLNKFPVTRMDSLCRMTPHRQQWPTVDCRIFESEHQNHLVCAWNCECPCVSRSDEIHLLTSASILVVIRITCTILTVVNTILCL